MMLLPNCGAVVTAALGCLGMLVPATVGRVLGIQPSGPLGTAELRATYGGFFLCLGIACLATQSATVFAVVGAAWCAAAVARLLSLVVDGSRSSRTVTGIAFEASIGLAMLSAGY